MSPPPQPSPGCTVRYFWLSTKSSTKQEHHEFSHPAFLPGSISVLIHIMKSSTLMALRGCKADKDGCRSGSKMMLYASLTPQCCLMHSSAVYIQFARVAFAFVLPFNFYNIPCLHLHIAPHSRCLNTLFICLHSQCLLLLL